MDVFISHSSQDKAVADKVCAALESAGLGCWIAPRNIVPGADWGAAIIEGIERSRLFVLVFTQHANRSPQVLREVERAVAKGIPIIPFRAENLPPTKGLEFFISSQHWLDAYKPPLAPHLAKLTRTAKLLLEGRAVDEPQGVPPPIAGQRSSALKVALLGGLALAAAVVTLIVYQAFRGKSAGETSVPEPPALVPTVASQPPPEPARSPHNSVYERILRERYSLTDANDDSKLSPGELHKVLLPLRGTEFTQRVFEALDRDRDGAINEPELLEFAAQLVAVRDQNRDGQLSISEFSAGARDSKKSTRETVQTVFRHRDRNRDGFISVRETEEALAIDWMTPD